MQKAYSAEKKAKPFILPTSPSQNPQENTCYCKEKVVRVKFVFLFGITNNTWN